MITVTGPDGVTEEFEDGTSPEEIDSFMRKKYRAPATGKDLGLVPSESVELPPEVPTAYADVFTPPTPPATLPPPPSTDLREASAPPWEMLGGTAGMMYGAPLGPLGMLGGGMLGAAGTALANINVGDVKRLLGMETLPAPPMRERLGAATRAAVLEGGFTTGTTAVVEGAKGLGKGLGRFFTSTGGKTARKAAEEAKAAGVDLGISDVSGIDIIRGYSKIAGRFPFVGTPVKRVKEAQSTQFREAFDRTLEQIGPSVTMTRAGKNLRTAGKKKYKKFRKEAKRLYDDFRALAKDSDAQIPSKRMRDMAAEYEKNAGAKVLIDKFGKVIPPPVGDPALKYIKRIKNLPDHISMREFERHMDDLDKLMAKTKTDGFKITHLLAIKHGAEQALQKIKGSPEVVDALRVADDYFSTTIKIFETPTGKLFGKTDLNIFKIGFKKPGSINPDELMRVVFNTKSPEALKDLSKIVGKKAMGKATGSYVRNVFDDALFSQEGKKLFDATRFRDKLGLGRPSSSEYESLQEILKNTDLVIKDFEDLANAAERAFSQGIIDPSTFLARKAVIGGAKSTLAAALPVVGAATVYGTTGAITAGLAVLAGRFGAKVLSEPRYLKLLTSSFNPQLPNAQRSALIVRLTRLLGKGEDE